MYRLATEAKRLRKATPTAEGPDNFVKVNRPDWSRFKDLFREWIESRLPNNLATLAAAQPGLQAQLTSELWRADMLEPDNPAAAAGYISLLKLSRVAEYPDILKIEAGITVPCGTDTSLYLYRFTSTGHNRLLEATGKRSWGDELSETYISQPNVSGARFLYISWLGVQCASVWNGLDYRLFRIEPGGRSASLLFSATHSVVIEDEAHVRLRPDDLLMELTAEAMEGGFRRTHVLHYSIESQDLKRIDPVALQPQDFVHEWLTRPWSEMQLRSVSSLEKWHKFLHADSVSGEYEFVQPCKERPGTVQVGVNLSYVGERELPESLGTYFLVRDKGDYRYEMSEINFSRQDGCPGETYATYDNPPSLFKKQ